MSLCRVGPCRICLKENKVNFVLVHLLYFGAGSKSVRGMGDTECIPGGTTSLDGKIS